MFGDLFLCLLSMAAALRVDSRERDWQQLRAGKSREELLEIWFRAVTDRAGSSWILEVF